MKKLLITVLLGVTCTTTFLPSLSTVAFSSSLAAPMVKDSYKDRSNVHIEDLKDEFSLASSSGISDVDFLNSEIAILRTTLYLSALIQSFVGDEQLIDLAEEIIEENSGVIRESRILIDKLDVAEKKNSTPNDDYSKSAKAINDALFNNLSNINANDSASLAYINQITYLIEASKSLADLISKSTKDTTIKDIAEDIINNANNNLETITEIKPAFK